MPALLTEESRLAALRALDGGVYAASSRKTHSALWRTIVEALGKYRVEPFPPSKASIGSLAAVLKAGSYASAVNYLTFYRVCCESEWFFYDSSTIPSLWAREITPALPCGWVGWV